MRTYDYYKTFLLNGKKLQRKKLEYKTWCGWDGDNIYIKHWYTNILYFYPNGNVKVDTGGWNSIATRKRINERSKVHIGTDSGKPIIYLGKFNLSYDNFLFRENFTLVDAITIGTEDLLKQWWETQTRPFIMYVFSRGFYKVEDRKRIKRLFKDMQYNGLRPDASIMRGWDVSFKKYSVDKARIYAKKMNVYRHHCRYRPFEDGMLFDNEGHLIED